MPNINALSLILQKIWARLQFLWQTDGGTDGQRDRRTDKWVLMSPAFAKARGTKITNSWVLEFVDWILHEHHENWYLTKIKPSTVYTTERHIDWQRYYNRSPAFRMVKPLSCTNNNIKELITHLFLASLDDVRCEVWQLFEIGVLAPHGLGDHLGQFHGSQGRREPTVTAQHIHTRLDQPHRLQVTENVNGLIEGRGRANCYCSAHQCMPDSASLPTCQQKYE